ncbi:hypothetical protein LC724_11180 [Blautia sp. RD014234]|nr:hypothetical protein [Blautia parvula]
MKQCMDNNDLHRRKKSSDIVSGMALITEAPIKPLQNLQKYSLSAPCTKSSTRPVQSTVKLHL